MFPFLSFYYDDFVPDSKNSSLTNSTTIDIGIPIPSRATETVSHSDEGLSSTANSLLSSTTITSTTVSSPSNFGDSTTEKLSLTNKSLSYSQPVAVSPTKETSFNDTKSSKTLSSNFKQHRIINSNVFHPINGGTRMSGQKIEMPQLNDFFDHSEYLKKHERGFRWDEMRVW